MDGKTPLYQASLDGYTGIVRVLLAAGGRAEVLEKNNHSLLHFAVYSGETDIIDMLIEAGVKVNSKDFYGDTPLHTAATKLAYLVQNLLEHKANMYILNHDGSTPLHRAAQVGRVCIIRALLEAGAVD